MMDLKSGQYKQNRHDEANRKPLWAGTCLFRLLSQISLPFYLDGFSRFLFNIFPDISGFGHVNFPAYLNHSYELLW